MRFMKAVFGLLLALTLFAAPALAQSTSSTGQDTTTTKTKKSAKKAADKTKDAAATAADKTKDAASKTADKTKSTAAAAKDKATGADKLDINTATKEQLMALPGIGDKYSDAIIKNRPYTAKNQIVSKAGVPQATYDKIKDEIIAHRIAAGSASKPTASTKQKKGATAGPADKK